MRAARCRGLDLAAKVSLKPSTSAWRLNAIVHMWPYADIDERDKIRAAMMMPPKWPPPLREFGSSMVATGNDALTLVTQGMRPDLVLSDDNLRGSMNGVESIKALRSALAWNVPAIVMTGDIKSKTIEAIATQDVSVVIKPFLAEELLQLMTRLQRSSVSRGSN